MYSLADPKMVLKRLGGRRGYNKIRLHISVVLNIIKKNNKLLLGGGGGPALDPPLQYSAQHN